MKWKAKIPDPKAKRLTNRKITITRYSGWEIDKTEIFNISQDVKEFIFDIEDSRDWVGDTSVIDGSVFNIWIEYSNESGSRVEKRSLLVEKENG